MKGNLKARKWRAPPDFSGGALNVCSAVSYFSTLLGSIIGAGRLSFRVRDGSGRFPAAMAAVTLCKLLVPLFCVPALLCVGAGVLVVGWVFFDVCGCLCGCEFLCVFVSFRPVSASSLHTLLCFQVWSIDPVVCGGPYPT